ncbi:phosphatidate cytidylyltransferase [Hymenobacter sp. 5317J-9]|uniref:phosphatidate cytidylyltransferase n=1 Tax=Hymenobacter sp. 5317J-9 TaxID=2932250 RepID=UPI001FD67C0B|nr:phosphatidate cytidylyltransferase [Hymenobacter sp. 5317J-9]UOQ98650.1 phosphatidate cytidylyltransferase [Hymenobacter sp. 5317J-9]
MSDSTPPITNAAPETPAAKAGPSNLRLRIIWGVIGAALLLGSVWFSPWTFGLFFALVQAVMLWEFYRMMRAGGYAPATWIGIGAGLILFGGTLWVVFHDLVSAVNESNGLTAFFEAAGAAVNIDLLWRGLAILLPVLLLIREMVVWPRYKQPFVNAATAFFGLMYIGVPMSLLNVIAYGNSGYDYRRIFALLFLIWASDIGAYAAGKTFGKHKMAPKISPGKTWEGWAGGFAMTLVVGWAIGFMLPDMPLTHRLVAAGVVAVFAPLGDLAESMLKRSVGVKDSGSIMPGHGGLLDRFDAFLLVLPVLALLQLLAG